MNKAMLFVYSGVGNGNPLQYCYPENPMDREMERERILWTEPGGLQSIGPQNPTGLK